MDVISQARILGAEIQKDERFIAYAKAKLANDNDEKLQQQIGEFNMIRLQLDKELAADPKDEEKVRELNTQLRTVYGGIMAGNGMAEYNAAKAAVDGMLNEINSIISMCVDGEDPETCDPHSTGCTGSCESCGGCH